MITARKPQPRTITRMRLVGGCWVVIRNGRPVYSNRVRTACETWVVRNPA